MEKPEFRKDLVSGDWVLMASSGRKTRPRRTGKEYNKKCPFEDPQKSGNPFPLLWYPDPETPPSKREDFSSWFVQVIPNKYPLLFQKDNCPSIKKSGNKNTLEGVGYHEVIITRDHKKTLAEMSLDKVMLVFKAYKERYRVLAKDPCVEYILIFHNHGESAGASLDHPHSQLIAVPVVDPDVARSIRGSARYFKENKKCVHCAMIEQEIKDKKRIVNKNKHFVSVVPFASHVSYETRIYPINHESRFEDLDKEMFPYLAEVFRDALFRIGKATGNPDYNFFIHTAPVKEKTEHYHWHIEIMPRGFRWAGLELGGGIEAVSLSPEECAENLRNVK
ncbi:MAG: DUF4921 family protein [Candidatus Marinimicrobia bacterium]|nr:DUF4921 family protein [Candidatus Neomarinimicrobiota bacterium]